MINQDNRKHLDELLWSRYVPHIRGLAETCELTYQNALTKNIPRDFSERNFARLHEAILELCRALGETDGELERELLQMYTVLHDGVRYCRPDTTQKRAVKKGAKKGGQKDATT